MMRLDNRHIPTDRLIESVTKAMYGLVKPGSDWLSAATENHDLVDELRVRAVMAVTEATDTAHSTTQLDLTFKRAFVESQ